MRGVAADHHQPVLQAAGGDQKIELAEDMAALSPRFEQGTPPQQHVLIDRQRPALEQGTQLVIEPRRDLRPPVRRLPVVRF